MVIETNLYYDARSEKHQIIFLNLCTVAALKLLLHYPVMLTAEASTWPANRGQLFYSDYKGKAIPLQA
jgi:hypothetical protein